MMTPDPIPHVGGTTFRIGFRLGWNTAGYTMSARVKDRGQVLGALELRILSQELGHGTLAASAEDTGDWPWRLLEAEISASLPGSGEVARSETILINNQQ